jgi:hypothetical protein
MPKSISQWVKNSTKNPTLATPVPKSQSQWNNNVVKNIASYTVAGKTPTSFIPEHPIQTYFYNDSKFSYNSPLTLYNTLVNNNVINQRLMTSWAAS